MNSSVRPSDSGGRSLLRLLAIGVLAWLASAVALIVWFLSTNTRDLGLGAVGVPFAMAGLGYLIGGGVLVGAGLLHAQRRRTTLRTVGWAVAIYIAPVALMIGWAAIIPRIAPLTASEADLGGMLPAVAFPVAFLLLALALAFGWSRMRREDSARRSTVAVLLTVVIGAVGFGAWQAWPQLSSPEARARGGLQFSVVGGRWTDGGLALDATLELSRDAAYQYHAIYLEDRGGTSGARVDEMHWPDGAPPARRGRHHFRLVWRSLVTEPRAVNRRLVFGIRASSDRTGYGPPVAEFQVPLDEILGALKRSGFADR